MLGKQELERLKAGLPVFENDAELATPALVECDACPRSSGCVETCMKAPASAEPSAPVAQCTNEDSWNCKYCRNTESCEALKDPRNFGEPSAPVEIDERADFEAAYDRGDLLAMGGPYENPRKNQAFAVWQARAALERKP